MAPRPSSRPTSRRSSGKPKAASAIDRLGPREAQAVLHQLLAAHADLRSEAEQMARSLLAAVTREAVAGDVEQALRALDLDDLGRRAGRHRDGYTSPTEAAWDLLQEAVEPFLDDLKRRLDLGHEAEAIELCQGLLLGLYRLRDVENDGLLEWAPDFPAEAAAHVVATWATHGVKPTSRRAGSRARPDFLQEFAAEHVPRWARLVAQGLERHV